MSHNNYVTTIDLNSAIDFSIELKTKLNIPSISKVCISRTTKFESMI